jgi:dTDP-4-amino-4,6-dideoxygalactose transaminase
LGGYGDGGMVLTNRKDLGENVKRLRNHGAENIYFHEEIGGNFRLDEIQAAVLRVKLKHLEFWQEKRRKNADIYDRFIQESELFKKFNVIPPHILYRDQSLKNYHTFHQYVIRVQNRDLLRQYLIEKKGISTGVYYPLPLHLQKCFRFLGYKKGDFPLAEKAASEVLALPIYPELDQKKQEYIITAIKEFYEKN